jgi:hypothetical protein
MYAPFLEPKGYGRQCVHCRRVDGDGIVSKGLSDTDHVAHVLEDSDSGSFSKFQEDLLNGMKALTDESTKEQTAAATLPCPERIFTALSSFKDLEEKMSSFDAETEDDIDKKLKACRDGPLNAIKTLCAAAVKLAKHIDETLKKEDRDMLTKAQGGKRKVVQGTGQGNKVFNLDYKDHTEIKTYTADRRFQLDDFNEPFVVTSSAVAKSTFLMNHIRLNHLVFRGSFAKDKTLTRDMKNLMEAEATRTDFLKSICEAEALAKFVGCQCANGAISKVTVFGYKAECRTFAPDLYAVGGIRAFAEKSGDIMILAIPGAAAVDHMKATLRNLLS